MGVWLTKELIRYHELHVLMCLQSDVRKTLSKAYAYNPASTNDSNFVQGEVYGLSLIDNKISGEIRKIREGERNETQR